MAESRQAQVDLCSTPRGGGSLRLKVEGSSEQKPRWTLVLKTKVEVPHVPLESTHLYSHIPSEAVHALQRAVDPF